VVPAHRPPPDDPALPRAVGLAAVLVALQGAGLLVLAAVSFVETLLGRAGEARGATVIAALALGAAVALLLVAHGLRGGRRWSRSPAVLTQLLVVPVAVTYVTDGPWWVGVPLLVWAATVLLLVVRPSAGQALRR
jgi:hypothetical protein